MNLEEAIQGKAPTGRAQGMPEGADPREGQEGGLGESRQALLSSLARNFPKGNRSRAEGRTGGHCAGPSAAEEGAGSSWPTLSPKAFESGQQSPLIECATEHRVGRVLSQPPLTLSTLLRQGLWVAKLTTIC